MANHKSAIKRHRQSEDRRARNQAAKSAVRTAIKKTRNAVLAGNIDSATAALKDAEIRIAKAATKGLYHSKNAARKISRLTRLVNKAADQAAL